MRIAILGLGREGRSLYRCLSRHEHKSDITILDRESNPNYLKNLDQFDIIYRSPGVPYNLPEIQRAIKKGVKISSATELFFEKANGKIIGVTGTKGKGTTSTLIHKILKNAGCDAYLAGNIGKPAIDILDRLNSDSVTILELSSFQLQGLHHSPDIAVVLGIFPDHMDVHKSFKEYIDAKAQITRSQSKNDVVIYVSKNKYAERIADISRGEKVEVNIDRIGAPTVASRMKIRGFHNLINAAVAATVAKKLNIPEGVISKTISSYRGLPFRLQHIGTIKGIKFYNDSASTNPMTTVAAIKASPKPTILIMGGRDKNLDFSPVGQSLKKSSVKLLIIYGECRRKIQNATKAAVKTKLVAGNLDQAVRSAISEAEEGDSVVFSPGATSFDMFHNYEDRGNKFNSIVKKLLRSYTSKSKRMQPWCSLV
ncbi:MAG: UDP-N-acetylmuramoyl-L-alanine--D-glutamate ligase [Patescibacteria group bacterium]|nr:UDP-N-acetylmuramoyl-L-alanine--D-glutamate ligase [Patescibacteria group bacterium]MCL5224159.1 UDP-N-acetylmuramoyl-L-alanine--D-glutamate ligase [Patescibacteria group bacterium]